MCDVAHAGVYEGTAGDCLVTGAWSVVRLPGHSSNCRVHALMPLMSAGRRGMSNFLILQDNINISLQWKYFWVGSMEILYMEARVSETTIGRQH